MVERASNALPLKSDRVWGVNYFNPKSRNITTYWIDRITWRFILQYDDLVDPGVAAGSALLPECMGRIHLVPFWLH
jgi:hypothetical protein